RAGRAGQVAGLTLASAAVVAADVIDAEAELTFGVAVATRAHPQLAAAVVEARLAVTVVVGRAGARAHRRARRAAAGGGRQPVRGGLAVARAVTARIGDGVGRRVARGCLAHLAVGIELAIPHAVAQAILHARRRGVRCARRPVGRRRLARRDGGAVTGVR